MNQRIRELAEQAGLNLELRAKLEEFAHLLLKDALDQMDEIVEECELANLQSEAAGARWAGAKVALHFSDE